MAEVKDSEGLGLLKYMYVEEFPESIDPETGEPYYDVESPMKVETERFGKRILHRIAKVKWTEVNYTQTYETTDSYGRTTEKEFVVKVYEEGMGELGGWIESKENLSQKGKCWVHKGAVVVGGAVVSGDAQIKGDAEIGGDCKVFGNATVSGKVAVDDRARVFGDADVGGDADTLEADEGGKWKKGMKRKRVAVKDNASVSGKVGGAAKVYENASVGPYAEISGKARVFGNARVFGDEKTDASVGGESVVYGSVVVSGSVDGKSRVFGGAVVGKGGKIKGEVSLGNGIVFGSVEGKTFLSMLFCSVGSGSKVVYYNDGESRPPLALKEKDMTYPKLIAVESRGADVIVKEPILIVGKGCTLEHCLFYGRVVIDKTRAKYCSFRDCEVSGCDLFDCGIASSVVKDEKASKSTIVDSSVSGGGQIVESDVRHCIVPKGFKWDGVSATGVNGVKAAQGCDMMNPVTVSRMDKTPKDRPYLEKPNYEASGMNGVVVMSEPYVPSTAKKIETKYGRFEDSEFGKRQERYAMRNSKILSLHKQIQERWKEISKIRKEGEMTTELYDEESSLSYLDSWVCSAVGVSLWDLDDSLWSKTYECIKKSFDKTVGNREAVLLAPYAQKFLWTSSNYYQWMYVPDFGSGPVEITPFSSMTTGPYIYTKVNGMPTSYPYSKGWLEYTSYMGGWFDYAPMDGMNELVRIFDENEVVELKDDQDSIENIYYGDLWIEYQEDYESLREEYNHATSGEERNAIHERMIDRREQYYKDYEERIGTEAIKATEEKEKSESDNREILEKDNLKRVEKIEKRKLYVTVRTNAVSKVRGLLSNMSIPTWVYSNEQLTRAIRNYVSAVGEILGKLMYGEQPDVEDIDKEVEKISEDVKRADELYAEYLRTLNEMMEKKREEGAQESGS